MSQDLDKVKAIIAQSGNTFHCKVLKYLQDKGWTVLISPYYNDNVSSKPREIDLIAEKAFKAKNNWGKFFGTVNVKLFIECKYISQKTVFWFHDKDMQKAEDLVTQTTPLEKDNIYTKKHHYLEGVDCVAKLFADERKKSADNEIFYKALNQSLNAMVYYRNKESIIKLPPGRNGFVLETVNYPIIVCNSFDNLYRVEIDTDAEPSNITENFQLEVNYAYMTSDGNNKNEYFLIDILNFDLFDSFLEKIEVDTGVVSFFLSP
jgi:Holliday junction resolvase-like predicted endonuclease